MTCISFIENTHSVAAASDNGSIHVFRVHFISAGKYGKCEVVRKIVLEDEFAVIMEHYSTGKESCCRRDVVGRHFFLDFVLTTRLFFH